jgi:hypothetical protein
MSEADVNELFELLELMNERITRIESRLVNLMIHKGLDATGKPHGTKRHT